MVTMSQLEFMEIEGFKRLGKAFKDTLTYVQIQRKKREIAHLDSRSSEGLR